MDTTKNHIGQNIRRIRELRGLKQDALGFELGISQKQVSHLEHQESVAEETVVRIAHTLGVSPHVITQFTEEAFINYCENFLNLPQDALEVEPLREASLRASSFTPHDKIFELYERLLQAEREKLAYVEKILGCRE